MMTESVPSSTPPPLCNRLCNSNLELDQVLLSTWSTLNVLYNNIRELRHNLSVIAQVPTIHRYTRIYQCTQARSFEGTRV